jgi:hypothetical protein
VFATAGHLSLSWARSIHCAPPLILFLEDTFYYFYPTTYKYPRLSKLYLSPWFPQQTRPLLSSPPFLSHAPSIWFFFIWSPKYCLLRRPDHGAHYYAVLLSHITSSVLGPNVFINTPFSNTLSPCFSLIVRDQVSLPRKTTNKMVMMMIIIIIFSRLFSIFWPSGFEMARICRKCTSTKQHLYKWKSEIQDWLFDLCL